MLKPITVKICGCAVINHPAITESKIIEIIRNTLFNITDVDILYKEECVVIQMLECSGDNLRALQFLKEWLWADYVILN
jgi:hypothetical protein